MDGDHRLSKANGILYSVRRNKVYTLKIPIKLGQYKLLVLPVLLYLMVFTNYGEENYKRLSNFNGKQ